MNITIICFVILITLSLLNRSNSSLQQVRLFLVGSFIGLAFFHIFIDVYSVPDLGNGGYIDQYLDASQIDILSLSDWLVLTASYKAEYGFVLSMVLCGKILPDFYFFKTLLSCLMIGIYLYSIKKYAPSYTLPVMVYFLIPYGQSIFVLRQHLAIALLLLCIKPIIERRILLFVVLLIVAFFFHKSALIFAPIYFIYNVKSTKKFFGLLFVAAISLSWVFGHLDLLNDSMNMGYDSYVSGEKTGTSNLTSFFISVIFSFTYFFFARRHILDEGINKVSTIAICINTIISFVGINLSLLSRFSLYFYVFAIFIVPITCKYIKNGTIKLFYSFGVILFLFLINFLGSFAVNLEDAKITNISDHLLVLVVFVVCTALFSKIIKNSSIAINKL